jgi:F-type H+-transporting ATPase subunit b
MNSRLIRIREWLPAIVMAGALVVLMPAAAAAAGQEAAGWRPTYDLIMRWVNFLILVFVIVKFARAPLKNFFKQKKIEVSTEIETMEAEKKAAEAKIAEARQAIEHRKERFEQIRERMIRHGKRRKEEIIEGARRESRLMIEAARNKVEGQIRQAHEKLREEMVDLAIDTAMERLPAEMQEADSRNLLNRYLEAMEQQ